MNGDPRDPQNKISPPPPPAPKVTIRTMDSDIESIRGGNIAPTEVAVAAPEHQRSSEDVKFASGYTGPESAPVFAPTGTLPARNEAPTGGPSVMMPSKPEMARMAPQQEQVLPKAAPIAAIPAKAYAPEKGGPSISWIKGVLLIIGVIIVLAALIAIGYFVILPLMSKPATQTIVEPITPPASPIIGQITTPTTTTTTTELTPKPATSAHSSFFATPADKKESLTIDLTKASALTVNQAIDAATQDKLTTGTLKEIVFNDLSNQPWPADKFLGVLTPGIAQLGIKDIFEDDFTSFAYYDQSGVWAGYILKARTNVVLDLAKAGMVTIEKMPDVSNLFIKSAGKASATGFKDSTIAGQPVRTLTYTKSGAAITYGWIGNYFILSSSVNGMKEAAKRLGL